MNVTVQPPLKKLLICVTFHFVDKRLLYLQEISRHFSSLAQEVLVIIFTSTSDHSKLDLIRNIFKDKDVEYQIITPQYLGHPYLLTWSHLDIFRIYFLDESFTHFLYIEDDMCIRPENISYWLKAREFLRPYKLIPQFFRYEFKSSENHMLATDFRARINFYSMPKVMKSADYAFINLPNPYQACYLMDRELMLEHLNGESSNPDFGRWDIRARAASGLTFANIPKGFWSRNVVGIVINDRSVDPGALIHHTPNNYADDIYALNAKIPINNLLKFGYIPLFFAKLQQSYLALRRGFKTKKIRLI